MATIEVLKDLIRDEATIDIKENYNKFYCVLDELECDYSLTINNLPEGAIVIKADNFPSPKEIFKGTKMECKRADYIIVTEYPKKRILYIELKHSKTSASPKEIHAQLKGAKCLIEYCKAIATEFWGARDFLYGYEPRYVKFISKTINKRRTRLINNSSLNNTPETAKKIENCSSIQFNQLVS